MAQNVTIAGASYTDVPAIDIPKTGGGTAKFVDTSDANATAPDIQSGKTAYVNGQKVTGTGSGATLQSKSVTYTSNGSATVTPDAGYDGLSSVDVTVNVSGGEACTVEVVLLSSGTVYYTNTNGVSKRETGSSYYLITDLCKNTLFFVSSTNIGAISGDGRIKLFQQYGQSVASRYCHALFYASETTITVVQS